MDQLRPYLDQLNKHRFWVLCVMVLFVGFVLWNMAVGSESEAYEKDKKVVDEAFSSLGRITSTSPNEKFKGEVAKLETELQDRVFEAWTYLYNTQFSSDDPLFVWPELVADIAQLKPVKDKEWIPEDKRALYMNRVLAAEWDRLFYEVAGTRRPRGVNRLVDETRTDDRRTRGEENISYEGLVVWSPDARRSLVERYRTESTPSSEEVRLTQEDLWIFEGLLDIIAIVNEGATDPVNAPIKVIEDIDIAQYAIAAAQSEKVGIDSIPASGDAGSGPGGTPGGPGGGGMMPGGADMTKIGITASTGNNNDSKREQKSEAAKMLDGRYLDHEGQPLAHDAAPPRAEYQQMFVRMKLIVDQHRVPDLLATCANASLPVEIRRVLVELEPESSTPGSARGAAGGMSGGATMPGGAGMPSGAGSGGMGTMPGGAGMPAGTSGSVGGVGRAGGESGLYDPGPYDVTVEVCGVINLYNPPDRSKVGQAATPATEVAMHIPGIPTKAVQPPKASGGRGMKGGMSGGGMMPTGAGMMSD